MESWDNNKCIQSHSTKFVRKKREIVWKVILLLKVSVTTNKPGTANSELHVRLSIDIMLSRKFGAVNEDNKKEVMSMKVKKK